MKHIFTFALMVLSLNLFAQNQCHLSHVVFNAPIGTTPQPIKNLGNNPQIKCLRNITNKADFMADILFQGRVG